MAATIHILPQHLADKIAAGEVVGRPASAVKELVENSLDAKATSITIVVKEGGKTLIQVIDDGTGMSPEDASLAFSRHATSKIATYDDLENIRTLGFRGEALASIAAVSQVELRTRQRTSEVGTKARVEGGMLLDIVPEAAQPGTSVTVRNLFYNTPGRRNFLKSTPTEYKYIVDIVQRVAIAHPEISLTFISNDETVFSLHPSDPAARVKSLLGEKLAGTIFPFEDDAGFVAVRGFLGKPDFARRTRTEQYLYLNGRPIVNRSINHAVAQGYENMLEKGSFPVYVLFLSIDPRKVDVNVHPSKLEVKFDDESAMHRFVFTAVRKALSARDLVPAAGMRREGNVAGESALRISTQPSAAGGRVGNWNELVRPPSESPAGPRLPFTTPAKGTPSSDPGGASAGPSGLPPTSTGGPEGGVPLWQVHNKYIVVATTDGLMIIDQHAAHERVLYERAIVMFNGGEHTSQQLLFPHSVEMSVGDVALVGELLPLLESLGFTLKIFGKTTVILDGVPTDIRPGEEGRILQQLVDLYKEEDQNVRIEPRERLAKSYSCKAAIKAGDPLKEQEMRALLDQLFGTSIPFVCPHGRPVVLNLSLAELDRRFGRTS